MRSFLAKNASVLALDGGSNRFLGEVAAGASGHGAVHLLVQSAGTIGSFLILLPLVSISRVLSGMPGMPRLRRIGACVRVSGVGVSLT